MMLNDGEEKSLQDSSESAPFGEEVDVDVDLEHKSDGYSARGGGEFPEDSEYPSSDGLNLTGYGSSDEDEDDEESDQDIPLRSTGLKSSVPRPSIPMYEKKSLLPRAPYPASTPLVLDQSPRRFDTDPLSRIAVAPSSLHQPGAIPPPSISGSGPATNRPSVDSSSLATQRSLHPSTATTSGANTSITTYHTEPSSQSPQFTPPVPQTTAPHAAPPDVPAQDLPKHASEVLDTGKKRGRARSIASVGGLDGAVAEDIVPEAIPGGRRTRNASERKKMEDEAALAARRAKVVEARQKFLNKAIEGNDWQRMLVLWERMEEILNYPKGGSVRSCIIIVSEKECSQIFTGPHSCAQHGILSSGSTGLDSKTTPKLG